MGPVTTLGTMSETPAHRLLLVHAHPDDESIGQGATMAKYAAEGRGVTLVTCTAGEMGEILIPELEHLAADKEDRLGEHRRRDQDLIDQVVVGDRELVPAHPGARDDTLGVDRGGHACS